MYKQIPYNTNNSKRPNVTSIADLQIRIFESYSTSHLKSICDKGADELVLHKNESRAVAKRTDITELLSVSEIKRFFEIANNSQLYFLAGNPYILNIIGEKAAARFLTCSYNTRKRLAKNIALALVVNQSWNNTNSNIITKLLNDSSPKVVAALYSNKNAIMLIPKEVVLHTLRHGTIQSKIAIASNPSTSLLLSKLEISSYILKASETDVKIAAARNIVLIAKAKDDVNHLLDSKASVIRTLLSDKSNMCYLSPVKLHKLISEYRRNPELKHLLYKALHNTSRSTLRRE